MARIAPATSQDLDALVDLWVNLVRSQRQYGTHLLAEANREVARDVLSQYVVADDVFVARDGHISGFVMFHLERGLYEQDAARGIVDNLYVRPESRGEGLGSRLLEAAEDALVEDGAESIALSVMATNDRAGRFYAERGFRPQRLTLEKPV